MFDCVICGNEHQDVDESCERAAYRRRLILTDQSRIAENEKRRAAGAREEREAVVRWLRGGTRPTSEHAGRHAGILADLIEAGEHRKP